MRGSRDRRRPAARLAAGSAIALLVLAAASYAAVRPGGAMRHGTGGTGGAPVTATTVSIVASGPPGLLIVDHPPVLSTRAAARFRVVAIGQPPLRCRLDRQAPEACNPISLYSQLKPGPHTFVVKARRPGRPPIEASFEWTVLEPKPFTIEAPAADVGPLYPGAAPLPIPVVISNPNPVSITVTSLRVAADGGAPGCDPAANLTLTAPDLAAARLQIPAHDSLSLPGGGVAAPTIALRELDVDQDACQRATFALSFSGSAGA